MPMDLGAHQRMNSSGLVQASNTIRAGASNTRVTAISSADICLTIVRPSTGTDPCSCLSPITVLLAFEVFDNLFQCVETGIPKLAIPLDPFRLLLEAARAKPAGAHAPDLLCGDQPRLFEDADMLLHARQRHAERPGKIGDRGVRTRQLLKHAPPCGIRKRGERRIKTGLIKLNHIVQYNE